jgi:hypothetical protein
MAISGQRRDSKGVDLSGFQGERKALPAEGDGSIFFSTAAPG